MQGERVLACFDLAKTTLRNSAATLAEESTNALKEQQVAGASSSCVFIGC
ncbi:MAG: hypothetical protein ACLSWV_06965 [Pygmaiobacter massiliensis]